MKFNHQGESAFWQLLVLHLLKDNRPATLAVTEADAFVEQYRERMSVVDEKDKKLGDLLDIMTKLGKKIHNKPPSAPERRDPKNFLDLVPSPKGNPDDQNN